MKIVSILILLVAAGCGGQYNLRENGFDYKITIIDGCQYIEFHTYGYPSVTHKGNCTNLIHKISL